MGVGRGARRVKSKVNRAGNQLERRIAAAELREATKIRSALQKAVNDKPKSSAKLIAEMREAGTLHTGPFTDNPFGNIGRNTLPKKKR